MGVPEIPSIFLLMPYILSMTGQWKIICVILYSLIGKDKEKRFPFESLNTTEIVYS